MKKFVYLVAPLLVAPFLASCGGNNTPTVVTHKVASVTEAHLSFTTESGDDLNGATFTEGKEFKFKVKAENSYTLIPEGIGIYVGNSAMFPLLDGYTFTFTKDDKTEALITIDGNRATDNMYIEGIAKQEGYYIYSVPVMGGVSLDGKAPIGYQEEGANLVLPFVGNEKEGGDTYEKPGEDDFLICCNDDEFKLPTEMEAGIVTVSDGTLTIDSSKITSDYVLITARAHDSSEYLENLSWSEIKEISTNGLAKYIFNIGDEKSLKIGNNTYHVRIIDLNHDHNEQGAVAGLTFQFEEVISSPSKNAQLTMWNKNFTSAHFDGSSLNTALNSALLGDLPKDLQKNIMEVQKYVGVYNSGWGLGHYNTKLFPLSHAEMSMNSSNYDVNGEGYIYQYYILPGHTRVAMDLNGTPTSYWLRTPRINDTGLAWTITEDGEFNAYEGAYVNEADQAVVPCFCI